jgi:hypothetical protein
VLPRVSGLLPVSLLELLRASVLQVLVLPQPQALR